MALTDTRRRRWVRAPSALWRRGLGVVHALGDGDVVELQGPAAVLWELLGERHTTEEAARGLAAVHGVAPDAIRSEVEEVLARLGRLGLLGSEDDPASLPSTSIALPDDDHGRSTGGASDDPAAAIAGWGLAGCPLALPDPRVTGWQPLLHGIRRERLTGLAVDAVRRGALELTEDELADLRAAHGDSMRLCLRLERLLLDAVARLERAGVSPLVIKGPAIAHRRYPDPAQRPFGDIDLLVAADELDAAYEVLADAGLSRRFRQPRPGFDRRFGKGAAFVADEGLEIDVHRTFTAGPLGLTADPSDAFRDPASFRVGTATLRTPGDDVTLVSLAMHAVLGTRLPHLLNLRDVAQVAVQVDTDDAVELATAWRVDAAVALAFQHATDRFHLPDERALSAWAADHRASRQQQRALAVYTSPSRDYSRQALAALRAIPGIRPRVAYLRAMLLPERAYRDQRHEGPLGRSWRLLRTAMGRR